MRTKLNSWLTAARPASDDVLDGQSMVEYAVILVLTTIVCIAAVALVGDSTLALYNTIKGTIGVALQL